MHRAADHSGKLPPGVSHVGLIHRGPSRARDVRLGHNHRAAIRSHRLRGHRCPQVGRSRVESLPPEHGNSDQDGAPLPDWRRRLCPSCVGIVWHRTCALAQFMAVQQTPTLAIRISTGPSGTVASIGYSAWVLSCSQSKALLDARHHGVQDLHRAARYSYTARVTERSLNPSEQALMAAAAEPAALTADETVRDRAGRDH